MEEARKMDKQAIRTRYLGIRNGLSYSEREQKSREIWKLLKEEEAFQKAQAVLVYMDYRSEVMTTGLVEELLSEGEKKVYAPKVDGMNILSMKSPPWRICSLATRGSESLLKKKKGFMTAKWRGRMASFWCPGQYLTVRDPEWGMEKASMTGFCQKIRACLAQPLHLNVRSHGKYLWSRMI